MCDSKSCAKCNPEAREVIDAAADKLSRDMIDAANNFIRVSGLEPAKNGKHAYIVNQVATLALAITSASILANIPSDEVRSSFLSDLIANTENLTDVLSADRKQTYSDQSSDIPTGVTVH